MTRSCLTYAMLRLSKTIFQKASFHRFNSYISSTFEIMKVVVEIEKKIETPKVPPTFLTVQTFTHISVNLDYRMEGDFISYSDVPIFFASF